MSRIHLRMACYVVTLALHLSNGLYMRSFHTEELLKDPEIRTFVGVQWRYITTWTFLLQMVYALIGLTCDWLTLTKSSNKTYKVPSILTETRDTLYSAIIWPSTFVTYLAALFWPFYLYDVQLVYPIFIDRVVTRLSNHVMHSFIIPIAVWEMLMRPQKRPQSEAKIVSIMSVYTVAYWAVLFYTYIEQDYWIYPIFKYVYGTIYLPVLICYSFLLLVINYKTQWIIIEFLYPPKKVNEKLLITVFWFIFLCNISVTFVGYVWYIKPFRQYFVPGHLKGACIMSNLGYLRMLGYVTTLTMHIGNIVYVGMNLKEDDLEDKRVRIFGETRRRYLTCWTFFLHMIYAIIGLTCEILLIKNSNIRNYSLPKHLKGCRDTIFAALLWPASLLVFTVFWSLFLYDRSLIFPDFIDKVLTPTSNHIMHTSIIPTILWEILLQPRFEPRSHVKYIAQLLVYMLVYLGVLIYTYMERGIWLYPIFKKLYGTIYFPLTLSIVFVLLLIFYRIQWTISYLIYGKEKTKKEKAKKVR